MLSPREIGGFFLAAGKGYRMSILFPNSDYFPLPPDYAELTAEGQRLSRVNACCLGGSPLAAVASWHFFRQYYLFSMPKGDFYPHGVVQSPPAHYQMIATWAQFPLTVWEAPRSFAKSTLVRETVLKDLLTKPREETALFLAVDELIRPYIDLIMGQIEHNPLIIEDFGKLKPTRGRGSWSHSYLKLVNGARLRTRPMGGASLGIRPHRLIEDDVEKDDSQTKQKDSQEEMIERARQFFLNVLYPMAESGVPIRIIGTKVHDRSFIHHLATTDDPRVTKYFHRTVLKAEYVGKDGKEKLIWKEKMSRKWLDKQRAVMGDEAYATQYLNASASDTARPLTVHPELCTYWMRDQDELAYREPLFSNATVVSHQLYDWRQMPHPTEEKKSVLVPIPQKVERRWGDVVSNMRRIITVDYAETITAASDYSVVHVLGLENNEVHRDTLWSLDIWVGRCPRHELVSRIFGMARKWRAWLVGIESYPVIEETADQLIGDVKRAFDGTGRTPAVIPIKIPTSISKGEKIKTLTWRFNQFRIKMPIDRKLSHPGYRALFDQVERFTPGLELLRHDDAVETLAMHRWIGVPRSAAFADTEVQKSPLEQLKNGNFTDEDGIPYLSAIDVSRLTLDDLRIIRSHHYEQREEENHVWMEEARY